ncbi:MAG TPA: hypothetical protein VLJ83_07060 [Gemmatimonadaceae bacterium]|nr:hypothetical protein [Gemmatimonadaceae bacterium]
MKKSIRVSARRPKKVISPDNPTLLEFLSALRRSVQATVITERRSGVPLAEIVAHVRELVRVREEATNPTTAVTSVAFRAISKCAVGWCVDAYLPSPLQTLPLR